MQYCTTGNLTITRKVILGASSEYQWSQATFLHLLSKKYNMNMKFFYHSILLIYEDKLQFLDYY